MCCVAFRKLHGSPREGCAGLSQVSSGLSVALVPGVGAAGAVLGALYALLGAFHLVAAPTDGRTMLVLAAWGTAVIAAATSLSTRHRGFAPAAAPHLAGMLALLAGANSLLHLAVTQLPAQTTNVMLVLVAVGAVVDHPRWAAGVGLVCLTGVGAVAAATPSDAAWSHFAFGLVSAAVLGLVLRLVRQRGLASLEAARAEAADAATQDSLTGLLNRRGLELTADSILRAARRKNAPVALLFIDLDQLKATNDTFGHVAGDALICEAARHLAETFRDADAVARVGGDEFAVLLLDAGPKDAAYLVSRARSALSRTPASVGVAAATTARETSIVALLDQADGEMYRDKQARRTTDETISA